MRLSFNFILCMISAQAFIFLIAFQQSLHFAPRINPMPKINRTTQTSHAKELFGSFYKSSVVMNAEKISDGIEGFILQEIRSSLPVDWQAEAKNITRTLIDEANIYGIDPIFVMALIKRESRFNPDIIGSHGEVGLMQIKPDTAEWIARKVGINWNSKSQLHNPCENLKIGMAYIHYLRMSFDHHGRFYLSAYNMGPAKLRQLVKQEKIPSEYVQKVMNNYVSYYQQLTGQTVVQIAVTPSFKIAKGFDQ